MSTQETYGTSSSLDSLISELNLLSRKYKTFLERESLTGDVQCLQHWVESYKSGRLEAAEYIHEYGYDLLSNVKRKLKAAELDIQRMDGESPNAEHFNGKEAHRISRAVALTDQMRRLIKKVTNEEMVH